jgi:diaminopimelate epimerase
MSVVDKTVPFEKYHGTGNDFIVLDAGAGDDVPDRPAFARAHCDRETGVRDDSSDAVGADGVLFLALEERYDPPRIVMTLVQPDGSVAAMCGNGARVAAAWAADRTGETEFMIDTPAGTRHASVEDGVGEASETPRQSSGETARQATIEMGVPSFAPRDVPLARDDPLIEADVEGLTVTAVDTGVPHAVAFVEDVPGEFFESEIDRTAPGAIDAVDLESLAPPVRHAEVFPAGANVTLAAPDGDGFRQRTYERGVEGETRSCGTGAVAIGAVARRLGRIDGDDPVRVSPPGGDLFVTAPAGESATLRGPVAHEFSGELDAFAREDQ